MTDVPWTPGPWKTSARANNMIDIVHSHPNTIGAITHALCRVQARQTWVAEAEANARLIAEAPAMAEALEEAYAVLCAGNPPHSARESNARRVIRAVLARIKGATP